MNTTSQTMHPERLSAFKWVAGGSATGALVSIAVIALAIIGLAGALPNILAAIATIVTGAAILIEGGSLEAGAAAFRAGGSPAAEAARLPSAEALGGIAGIVLGILALLGVSAETLLSVAVLVFGATMLLAGGWFAEHSWFSGPADGQLLLGLGVTVLGLLAVIGISQLSLVLVGLLVMGVGGLFGGSTRSFKAVKQSEQYSSGS